MKVWIHLSEERVDGRVMHEVRNFRGVFESEVWAREYLLRTVKSLGGEWRQTARYPGYCSYDLGNLRECIFEYDMDPLKQFDDPDAAIEEKEKASEPVTFTVDELDYQCEMAYVRGINWAADELLKVAIKYWTDGDDDLAQEVRRIQEGFRETAAEREFEAKENQAKESGG